MPFSISPVGTPVFAHQVTWHPKRQSTATSVTCRGCAIGMCLCLFTWKISGRFHDGFGSPKIMSIIANWLTDLLSVVMGCWGKQLSHFRACIHVFSSLRDGNIRSNSCQKGQTKRSMGNITVDTNQREYGPKRSAAFLSSLIPLYPDASDTNTGAFPFSSS